MNLLKELFYSKLNGKGGHQIFPLLKLRIN